MAFLESIQADLVATLDRPGSSGGGAEAGPAGEAAAVDPAYVLEHIRQRQDATHDPDGLLARARTIHGGRLREALPALRRKARDGLAPALEAERRALGVLTVSRVLPEEPPAGRVRLFEAFAALAKAGATRRTRLRLAASAFYGRERDDDEDDRPNDDASSTGAACRFIGCRCVCAGRCCCGCSSPSPSMTLSRCSCARTTLAPPIGSPPPPSAHNSSFVELARKTHGRRSFEGPFDELEGRPFDPARAARVFAAFANGQTRGATLKEAAAAIGVLRLPDAPPHRETKVGPVAEEEDDDDGGDAGDGGDADAAADPDGLVGRKLRYLFRAGDLDLANRSQHCGANKPTGPDAPRIDAPSAERALRLAVRLGAHHCTPDVYGDLEEALTEALAAVVDGGDQGRTRGGLDTPEDAFVAAAANLELVQRSLGGAKPPTRRRRRMRRGGDDGGSSDGSSSAASSSSTTSKETLLLMIGAGLGGAHAEAMFEDGGAPGPEWPP